MQSEKRYPLIIIGAGPAGLMAACSALREKVRPLILEASAEAGLKLLLTGGGRCNISNLLADPALEDHYHGQAKFLRPAMRELTPQALSRFFAERALPLIAEEEVKLYPSRGGARAVRQVFLDELKQKAVHIRYRERVLDIRPDESGYLLQSESGEYRCLNLILAAGGASFPHTGSDGSALSLLQKLSVRTRPFTPALSSLILETPETAPYSGISLRDCKLSLTDPESRGRKKVAERGEILWTSFGISGPPVFNLSRYFPPHTVTEAELDILPGSNEEETEQLLQQLLRAHRGKCLKNIEWPALPQRLRSLFLRAAGQDPELQAAHLNAAGLRSLAGVFRHFPLKVSGVRGMNSAYLSRGGVLTEEVNPRNMSLKRHPGLFVAGELLDIDGDCGGFSLQLAFSTGYLAGKHAALRIPGDTLPTCQPSP